MWGEGGRHGAAPDPGEGEDMVGYEDEGGGPEEEMEREAGEAGPSGRRGWWWVFGTTGGDHCGARGVYWCLTELGGR